MADPKFTRGPWKWWTSNSWRRLKLDDIGIAQNVLEPYVMRDGHPDVSVSDADMALIAAAPDLYEALHELADVYENCGHDPEGVTRRLDAFDMARAALAKARGANNAR